MYTPRSRTQSGADNGRPLIVYTEREVALISEAQGFFHNLKSIATNLIRWQFGLIP